MAAEEADVDRHLRQVLGFPVLELKAGLLDGPGVDGAGDAGFFGDGDELGVGNQPALWVIPAELGFEADDFFGFEGDDGEIVEAKFLSRQRIFEIGFDVQALHGDGVHAGVEDDMAGAAGGFGMVHRGVGVAQQFLGGRVIRVAIDDADADGGVELMAFEIDGLGELALDALGDERGIVFGFEIVEEDGEFIAAKAGDGVGGFGGDGIGGAEATAEAIADGDQQSITGGVAEAVVDDLEAIQIQKKHGKMEIGSAAGALDAALHLVVEK